MDVCFPGRETHITKDMSFRARGTHITSDMSFPGKETHITKDMCSGEHISRGNTYYCDITLI